MGFLSTKIWVILQVGLLAFLFLFFWYFIRNTDEKEAGDEVVEEAADRIMTLLEPLLKEAETSAGIIEQQIMEKKEIIRTLNRKLDDRIISLTLLLNRAEATLAVAPGDGFDPAGTQEAILALYNDGCRAEEIAQKLSLSSQEVELVIGLKRKFLAMEEQGMHLSKTDNTG